VLYNTILLTDTSCVADTTRAWHEHFHATRSLQSYC